MKEYSNPAMLYLDFDQTQPPPLYQFHKVFRLLKIAPEWYRYDRTRRGWHVLIKLPRKLPKLATVALQAILGSDPARESLNLMRALSPHLDTFAAARWNVLFREKYQ